MAFGDKLLELLEEKDISQKEFAQTLNIAATTLNGYIKNKRQPDFELVKSIAFIYPKYYCCRNRSIQAR